ncbi:MAG: (2Fe-2S)-binding protein [Cloacibacillus evryensis]
MSAIPPEEQERCKRESGIRRDHLPLREDNQEEIRDAIEYAGAKTLVSIKYRARNGMGRCQGGFCTPRIVRMLRRIWLQTGRLPFQRGRPNLFTGNVREGEDK